jgi:hypothetical protein
MNIAELDQRAMLVSLTIPTIQSVATVRDTTRRVVNEENASRDAVRVVAAKLPTARAAAVQSRLDAVRSLHTALTLPFMGQFRLLRAETYLDYLSKLNAAVDLAVAEARAQFDDRPSVLADVARQMGDIPYDPAEIPSADTIAKRVRVSPAFLPITTVFGGGLSEKLGISEKSLNALNNQQVAAVNKVAEEATREVLAEVADAVTRVVVSLIKYDEDKPEFNADGKRTRRSGFHATMVTNLAELSRRLPALDLTTDLHLTSLSGPLMAMARYDTDTLKNNARARSEILQEATNLLSTITHTAPPEDFGDDEMFGGLL